MRPDLTDLKTYNLIIVAFSGGKDSTAAVLHLLRLGVPRDRIELWHHDVDGRGERFMDWPVTPEYCRAFAGGFRIPIRFSWREGGFKTEMLRAGTATAPIAFETSKGVETSGGEGPPGTRLKFPQRSSDLKTRWCTPYLKIDVARRVFARDWRFESGKFLLVTGERRQESPARAKYTEFEEHASSTSKRIVHQWRAVIDWSEEQVWEIIKEYRVRPHPAYYLGWGRVSCMFCIFGDPDQWASARELDPKGFRKIADHEKDFGVTIDRKLSVDQMADKGKSFLPESGRGRRVALSEHYPEDMIFVPLRTPWKLPAGAFKRAGGPT